MTITLTPDIEAAVAEQARQQGKTLEGLVIEAVLEKLALTSEGTKGYDLKPRDEWERRILGIGIDAGVSLTDEQLTREAMYEDGD